MGAKSKRKKNKEYKLTFANVITRLIATWCIVVFAELGSVGINVPSDVSPLRFVFHFLLCFGILSLIHYFVAGEEFDPLVLLVSLVVFGSALTLSDSSPYYILATFLVFALTMYCYKDVFLKIIPEISSVKLTFAMVALFGVMITAIVATLTIMRYEICASSAFDMGIFAQMYYNMREHLTMVTTCERNHALSHLSVHTSLIYYLILPIYAIFPHNTTLLFIQALMIGIGIIPLTLLTGKLGFNNTERVAIALIYALSPATFGGAFYDFHENVFLIPLLMFLFWCYEEDKLIPTVILAILVCTVKEDATLFVIVLGIYTLLGRRSIKKGIILTGIGGAAMAIAFRYIAKHGDGLMTFHYQNLVRPDHEGMLGILLTMVTNPGYLITQIFTADKLVFVLTVIFPIGFLAFVTKKISRYILLVPFIFVNLLPEYVYQHDIFYQYVFGPYMFIIYTALLNMSDIEEREKRYCTLLTCVLVGVTAFAGQMGTKTYYKDNYKNDKEVMEKLDEGFEIIPQEASVSSSTFFVPKLAKRDEIYMVDGDIVNTGEIFDTDYAIFDLRPGYANETVNEEITCYLNSGYEEIARENEVYSILKKIE